jgi:anti-sigma-K factor RskA
MSNPENHSRLEELAALHSLNLLDEAARKELRDAAGQDAEIERLVREFDETAALLAHDAPSVPPPPELRKEILNQASAGDAKSNIISFPQWLPYAIAAGLMVLGIVQLEKIVTLKKELAATREDAVHLRQSNALMGLKIATLQAKDAAYSASTIIVAWDPYRHDGVVSMQNLPTPPAGRDYQLWVLDPEAEAPVSAGLITGSRAFATGKVSTPNPGFAISLEPSGGSATPSGPILFAVAPGS